MVALPVSVITGLLAFGKVLTIRLLSLLMDKAVIFLYQL